MLKKLNHLVAILLVTTMTLSIPVYAQLPDTSTQYANNAIVKSEKSHFDSSDDEILNEMIEVYGITEEQVKQIDEYLTTIKSSPQGRSPVIVAAAVVTIVVGVVSLMGATYSAGRYAARQCEVRLGLTKRKYRANRWGYRGALAGLVFAGGVGGGLLAIGFDDYYMGV